MKKFIFDRLVDEENLCNLTKEKNAILQHIKNKNKVVIYAPRNYGKTSLIKNVIIPRFKKSNKNSFVFFTDLMEVKDMNSLISRMLTSFEHSFASSFPVKNIMENLKKFIQNIQPEITIDPITSQPGLSLKIDRTSKNYSLSYLFKLLKNIKKNIPILLVFDEFQDIINIEEAQSVFRNIFEDIGDVPIIIMGSKKHLLSKIFASPNAPLSFWGQDLDIKPIDYKEYHKYIQERFDKANLIIDYERVKYIQDILRRIPEPINIICQQILDNYSNKSIMVDDVNISIKNLIESKESRYESYLSTFTKAEEKVCINLAKVDNVTQPQSKNFVSRCGVTSRTVGQVIKKFTDKGIIEKNGHIYRLSDPLFNFFLKIYR